jgi:hypothetical protein
MWQKPEQAYAAFGQRRVLVWRHNGRHKPVSREEREAHEEVTQMRITSKEGGWQSRRQEGGRARNLRISAEGSNS